MAITSRPRRRRHRSRRPRRRNRPRQSHRHHPIRHRSHRRSPSRCRGAGCTSHCRRTGPAPPPMPPSSEKTKATMPANSEMPRMLISIQVRKPDQAAGGERATHATEEAPEDRAADQRKDEQERQQVDQAGDTSRGRAELGLRQGLALDHTHDAVDAGADAVVVIAALERGRDVLLDDAVGRRVGQRAFEAVADLDAHLAVVQRDQQQHAVIDLAAAELPLVDDADRILLDDLGLRRRHDQDHDLAALRLLERRELGFERGRLVRRQRAGEVGDPRRELGNGDEALLRERRRRDCRQQPQHSGEKPQASPRQTGYERESRGDHGITPRRAPWGTRREECLSWSQGQAWAPGPAWPAVR